MKCRSCKETELSPDERKKFEDILVYALPLVPYRCDGCDHRQYGFTQPLFDKPRIISASVLGLIIVVFILSIFLGGSPEEKKTAPPEKVAAQSVSPDGETDRAETDGSKVADASGQEDSNPVSDVPAEDTSSTPVADAKQGPRQEVVISQFVQKQLEKNQAKRKKE